MNPTRRELLLAGLGLFIAGCAYNAGLVSERPRTEWPDDYPQPSYINPNSGLTYHPPQPITPSPLRPTPEPGSGVAVGALKAIPRSAWATAPPIASRILPMDGVNRITCHHEGWTPVWFADYSQTRERMDSIRESHIQRLHAGDIGYHFVIDRSGRLWEGRSLKYQGAHVKDANEHNIGVMTLGNFDLQSPTSAQLATLRHTVSTLMREYHVPVSRVYTHQEINPTRCPGVNLQPRISTMRSTGELA